MNYSVYGVRSQRKFYLLRVFHVPKLRWEDNIKMEMDVMMWTVFMCRRIGSFRRPL
jgi:hypothetical protein